MNPENATIENIRENPALVNAESDGSPDFKISDCHYRMASCLITALTVSDSGGWSTFTDDVQAHLLDYERAALAEAALRAIPYDDALSVALEVIGAAGRPLPACLGGMSTARNWAWAATHHELKAYALASFEALPPAEQAAFLNHVNPSQKERAA